MNLPPRAVFAAGEVLKARAYKELIEPIVTGYQKEILASHNWTSSPAYDRDPKVILDPERSYLLHNEDFEVYLAECRVKQAEAGLVTEKPEYCPLLVAKSELVAAERRFAEIMCKIVSEKEGLNVTVQKLFCKYGAYEAFIDLSMKLVVPFIDKEELLRSL